MPRVGVDGVTEQQKLDERNHHNHRERDAVPLELDEFLDQHRQRPAPEAAGRTRCGRYWQRRHCKRSWARPMRSMNTSSSDGSERVQASCGCARYGAMAASSAVASRAHTCRLVPNGATMSTPARRLNSSASALSPSPSRALTV